MPSLLPYNTFGIAAQARAIEHYTTADDLARLLRQYRGERLLPVGSGSNLLFISDFDGVVLVSDDTTITAEEYGNEVLVRCGAGVVWDEFVDYSVNHGWYGVENLSLIPGTCGASAVQNIGAYGTEAKDVITSVEAVNRDTLQREIIPVQTIRYGYRTSRFKTEWADKYIITVVNYRLLLNGTLNLEYRGLKEAYESVRTEQPSMPELLAARHAVMRVRRQKLPEVGVIGSAGSFFMNPAVSRQTAIRLVAQYPDIPHFANNDGTVKIPAAWLIEQTGWKGYREGDAGVYDKQPLVLVNYGHATGKEIAALAEKIQNSVMRKFGIALKTEVIYV